MQQRTVGEGQRRRRRRRRIRPSFCLGPKSIKILITPPAAAVGPRRPPPTGYEALWNRLARQVARRPRVSALEGAALAAAAAAALAGLSALDRGADALWATHNRGKSFEDIPKRRGAR